MQQLLQMKRAGVRTFAIVSVAARGLAVMGLTAAGLTAPATAAYVVLQPSSRPVGVAAPLLPTSAAQCNDFATEVADFAKQLGERHESCLRSESRNGGKLSHKGQCSFAACEPAHTAIHRFGEVSRKEIAECRERAAQAEREVREVMSAFRSIEEAQTQLSKFAPLAVQKMRDTVQKKLEQQVGAGIDKLRRQLTPSEASRAAQDISIEVMKAAAVCRRDVATARTIECEKQAYLSIASLQSLAPFAAQGDKVISKIQAEAFKHLNRINEDTLRRIQTLSQISEEGADDDDGGVSLGR